MSNFKELVEARIAKTGESWSTAANRIRAQVLPAEIEGGGERLPVLAVFARRRDFDLPIKLGKLDGSDFSQEESSAVLNLTATRQLIRLLGAAYRNRPFDLVHGGEMLVMC